MSKSKQPHVVYYPDTEEYLGYGQLRPRVNTLREARVFSGSGSAKLAAKTRYTSGRRTLALPVELTVTYETWQEVESEIFNG